MISVVRSLLFAIVAAATAFSAAADPGDGRWRRHHNDGQCQTAPCNKDGPNNRGPRNNGGPYNGEPYNNGPRNNGPYGGPYNGGPNEQFRADRDQGWRGRGPGYGQRDHDRARDGVMSGRLLPLEAVLANIARIYPGTHIGVDGPYEWGGRWCYRIKWLTPDGRVLIIIADAETGQILSQRGGR